MPSNAELSTQAANLAEELNLEIDTEGLNNAQLAALVSDLKAKADDASLDTQADTAAKATKKPAFYVAPRKAITTKRGILTGDSEDEVKAGDLHGGKATLEALVESEHVLKG